MISLKKLQRSDRMSVKKFHVAYITDDNYAMPTCVSIISLFENKRPDVFYYVHIITDNVSDVNKNHLMSLSYPNCKIEILDADSSIYKNVQDNKTNFHVSKAALLKFNLPELFSDIDTLLYIDGDTLIIQDISELFEMDISKCYAGVVENLEALNFSSLSRYFNNGVMLLNLKKMRSDNMTEKLIDYRKNGINYYMDQDTFNIVFNENVLFLPAMYNFRVPKLLEMDFDAFNEEFCSNYSDTYECLISQKILHCVRKLKPWKYYLPWVTDIFTKYQKLSPYKTEPLKLKSPFPVIIKSTENTINKMDKKKEWRFPREKIPKGSKVILYGAGEVGRVFYDWINDTGYCNLLLWVDEKYDKINSKNSLGGGCTLSSPENIKTCDQYDYVLVATVKDYIISIVSNFLNDSGVPKEKIVILSSK